MKALSDIIVTSANAAKVVRTLPNKNILFVPDRNLARHVAEQVPEKNIIPWEGFCYVHQQITPQEVARIREADPEIEILVHPECRADVAKLADAVLSTSGMVKYAKERPAKRFLVVTECGLSDRLAMEVPDKTFVKGCKLCTFMKVTSLEDVRDSLQVHALRDRGAGRHPRPGRARAAADVRGRRVEPLRSEMLQMR